jgi:hypothetical protein
MYTKSEGKPCNYILFVAFCELFLTLRFHLEPNANIIHQFLETKILRKIKYGPVNLHQSCRNLVHWVPRVTSYNPTNLDMTWFFSAAKGWGSKYPILDMVSALLDEGEGPPT